MGTDEAYVSFFSDKNTNWLATLKYIKFVKEIRKHGQISCLRPSVMWCVQRSVPDVAEITCEQAMKVGDIGLLKILAQVS